MTPPIHTRDQAKAYAKIVRADHAEQGNPISYSAALEHVAKALGFTSWNLLCARLSNDPPVLQVGDQVEGRYLKQPFEGTVLAVRELGNGDAYQVSIQMAQAVDVVTFDSFSAFRQRINATISRDGISPQKTSDGVPHLVITQTSSALV